MIMEISATLDLREATREDFIRDGRPWYGRIYFICQPGDDLLRGPHSLSEEFVQSGELKRALQDGVLHVLRDDVEQPWEKRLVASWRGQD